MFSHWQEDGGIMLCVCSHPCLGEGGVNRSLFLSLIATHWLPICYYVIFKGFVLIYKALNNLGPGYFRDQLIPCIPAHLGGGSTVSRPPWLRCIICIQKEPGV